MKITIGTLIELDFETDNDAFQDGNKELEIERIIAVAKEKVARGETSGRVMDINGNSVGTWKVKK